VPHRTRVHRPAKRLLAPVKLLSRGRNKSEGEYAVNVVRVLAPRYSYGIVLALVLLFFVVVVVVVVALVIVYIRNDEAPLTNREVGP